MVDTLGDSTFRTVGAHDVGLTPGMVFDVDKFLAEVAIKTKVLNSFLILYGFSCYRSNTKVPNLNQISGIGI